MSEGEKINKISDDPGRTMPRLAQSVLVILPLRSPLFYFRSLILIVVNESWSPMPPIFAFSVDGSLILCLAGSDTLRCPTKGI